MIAMSLHDAMLAIEGAGEMAEVSFKGVSIDSRTLSQGELFVAIKGPNFDGHDYVNEAQRKGAAAAMVSQEIDSSLPVLRVGDTRKALSLLAKDWRRNFNLPLIALTGSNGKTTVKEMLAAILRVKHQVLVTKGNYNNDLGVPLTLSRLSEGDEYAVIELGANHLGEILQLSQLASPDVALITNIGTAHLEGFGSQDNIAMAKSEIFQGLSKQGVAVINRDDKYYDYLVERAGDACQISFGQHKNADVRLIASSVNIGYEHDRWSTYFELESPIGGLSISLGLSGRHNIQNALAAIAICCALEIDKQSVEQGLASLSPVAGRMQIKPGMGQWSVIDDTYNANPASLEAAIDVLAELEGKKILVIGDMAELGESSASMHESIGLSARHAGINKIYAVGDYSKEAALSFGKGGCHYASQLDLVNDLIADLHSDDRGEATTVLVKGSRSAQMERVVDALIVQDSNGDTPKFALGSR